VQFFERGRIGKHRNNIPIIDHDGRQTEGNPGKNADGYQNIGQLQGQKERVLQSNVEPFLQASLFEDH